MPSSRSAQVRSLVRTPATKLRACFSGSRPTVSVSPNRSDSRASGITKVRVMFRFIGLASKRVASQRVAARLVRATRASVPIHGRSTPTTGGRSTSPSMAGTSPTGTGRLAVSSGFSAHGPVSGRRHSSLTASPSSPAALARTGRRTSWVRVKVTVVARPVRAMPASIVVSGRFQLRSTRSLASSPTRSTSWVASSCTLASLHPPNQPSMASYAALALRPVVDISTVCTMLRRD